MGTPHKNTTKNGFTAAERQLLSGVSGKLADKHSCSSMYVRYIIRGERGTKTEKAKKIVKDLKALVAILRPEV